MIMVSYNGQAKRTRIKMVKVVASYARVTTITMFHLLIHTTTKQVLSSIV